jgi:hypothetical protein
LSLPTPPQSYDQRDQALTRGEIERRDGQNYKKGQNLSIGPKATLIFVDAATGANHTLQFSGGLLQVDGSTITGWGTPTGGARSSGAAYAGQTMGASYSQTAAQQTDNAVKTVSQQITQLIADLETLKLVGT